MCNAWHFGINLWMINCQIISAICFNMIMNYTQLGLKITVNFSYIQPSLLVLTTVWDIICPGDRGDFSRFRQVTVPAKRSWHCFLPCLAFTVHPPMNLCAFKIPNSSRPFICYPVTQSYWNPVFPVRDSHFDRSLNGCVVIDQGTLESTFVRFHTSGCFCVIQEWFMFRFALCAISYCSWPRFYESLLCGDNGVMCMLTSRSSRICIVPHSIGIERKIINK